MKIVYNFFLQLFKLDSRIRHESFPYSHVFILAFSVVQRSSFEAITNTFLEELVHYKCDSRPIVLIGMRSDLRKNKAHLLQMQQQGYDKIPVAQEEAIELCKKMGFLTYIEISSLENENVKEAMETIVAAAIAPKVKEAYSNNKSISLGIEEMDKLLNSYKQRQVSETNKVVEKENVNNEKSSTSYCQLM